MFALAHLKLGLLQDVCVSLIFVFVFVPPLCFTLFFTLHISNGVNCRPDVSPVSVGAPPP